MAEILGIDNLKGSIKGLAYSSLYQVSVTAPGNLAGSDEVNNIFTYTAESVTLPGRDMDVAQIGGSRASMMDMPTGYKTQDVQMTLFCTGDYAIRKLLEKWFFRAINPVFDENGGKNRASPYMLKYHAGNNYTGTINIAQLDQRHEPIFTAKLINAWPKVISNIQLSSANVEASTLDVTWAYEDYTIS